jgi:Domain of unknown function (DUF4166)
MTTTTVSNWFGEAFSNLHPLLQELHKHGGKLNGRVRIEIPDGLRGVIGKRLAKKLGVPTEGAEHKLEVMISHENGGLQWNRCFDNATYMRSTFTPVGTIKDGYWLEDTGPLAMRLTVDTRDGGWHWRCLSMRFLGVPLPLWLFPNSKAYKLIEDNKYRFYVGFSLPLLGNVLSYSGVLASSINDESIIWCLERRANRGVSAGWQ